MLFRDYDPFFDASPAVRALYGKLAAAVRRIGPFEETRTKISINLVRGAVFLTAEPQIKAIRLTVKSEAPIDSPRILRSDHMTRTRWHNDLKLGVDQEIDPELIDWIKTSYELCELASQPAVMKRKKYRTLRPGRT
jgi:hypothetical protein